MTGKVLDVLLKTSLTVLASIPNCLDDNFCFCSVVPIWMVNKVSVAQSMNDSTFFDRLANSTVHVANPYMFMKCFFHCTIFGSTMNFTVKISVMNTF